MIINEDIFKKNYDDTSGYDTYTLYKLISSHGGTHARYERLWRYYLGEHDILSREKSSKKASNSRVVCNHAKYITDMGQSYLAGNPITYSAAEGIDIEPIKAEYFEQDMASKDSEIVKKTSIFGHSYELVYSDEESTPRSAVLDPKGIFVLYDDTAAKRKMAAIQYYKRYDIDGNCTGSICVVYDKERVWTYESGGDSFDNLRLAKEPENHYFGKVPVIEYKNNGECQGDFEQIISIIDAYNLLCSDRVDDKADFVDAFLFLRNIELDSEQAKKLKEEKILMGEDGSLAQYLAKVMTETDVKVLRDDLKEDIHRFSMVPDLSDNSFGNNLSGVAIRYKLMGFEQATKNKERFIAKGLRERLELYSNFLSIKKAYNKVKTSDVDIIFTRNLPTNDLETAQMINYLSGVVSNETLLEQVSFVTDAAEEQRLVDAENEGKYQERMKEFTDRIHATEGIAKGDGYNGDSYNSY